LRGYPPRRCVEQAHRWLCHPAVIPISPVTGEIWEYLLSDVLGPVHIGISDQPTLVTHVQPTFNTLAVVDGPARTTGLGGTTFVHALNTDAVFGRFVFQHLRKIVERPPMEIEVAVVTPVCVLADTSQIAHDNRSDVSGGALGYYVLRDSVEKVCPALATLAVQPLCFAGGTIVALRPLFLEVVIILFECATGIQQSVVANRNGGEVADTEVDTGHSVAGWVRVVSFDVTHNMQLPVGAGPDSSDLLDVLDGHIRVNSVLTENKVLTPIFQILPLRESNPIVVGVVLEPILFERDRRAWVVITVLAVAGRVRLLVTVPTEWALVNRLTASTSTVRTRKLKRETVDDSCLRSPASRATSFS